MSTTETSTDVNLTSDLRVEWINGAAHLQAVSRFETGDVIMNIEGRIAARPDRYSVQIGKRRHIAPPHGLTRESNPGDRYLWRFLNHSCRPNAVFRGRRLLAIAPIAAGEEVTFDYNCNEYDMNSPFSCHCGHCGGVEIRGYSHLTPEEKLRRARYVSRHLLLEDRPVSLRSANPQAAALQPGR